MPRANRKNNKAWERNTFREVPCIIGLDQSYQDTGLAICIKGKVKKVKGITFKGLVGNTQKRWRVQANLRKAIESCLKHYKPEEIAVIVERVRTYTAGDSLRIEVIKSASALVACIIDTAMEYGIKTYSVDTRAWKSRVLGDSRPVFEPVFGVSDPQKFGSVRKAISLGFIEKLKVISDKLGKNNYRLDDNIADAICISLYPFSGYPYTLKLEK